MKSNIPTPPLHLSSNSHCPPPPPHIQCCLHAVLVNPLVGGKALCSLSCIVSQDVVRVLSYYGYQVTIL